MRLHEVWVIFVGSPSGYEYHVYVGAPVAFSNETTKSGASPSKQTLLDSGTLTKLGPSFTVIQTVSLVLHLYI